MATATQSARPMTTDEVSERTGTPAATLRWFRHMGIGPRSYRLGRRVVYDRQDVEDWMTQQKQATAAGGTATA